MQCEMETSQHLHAGSWGCPPVSKKALDSAAAYQISFMFLEWVPASEPEFVDSHEKNIL